MGKFINNSNPQPQTNQRHPTRDQWEQHPHYPAQVLLVGSHANFRAVNRQLIGFAEELANPGGLEGLYRRWIGAMRSHEAYEERKLYPYLAKRWSVSFDAAEAGHALLHAKHDGVMTAFEAIRAGADAVTCREGLLVALREHEAVLVDHLRLEEDMVIPLLLSLEPEQFDHYCHSSIGRLMQDFEGA